MLQRHQHRVAFEFVAVGHAPLQFANPHRHAGQFGGVFVQFYAQHVVRAGYQVGLALQAQRGGFQVALVFQVFQRLEAQKQKVAAAAGRVQHAVVLQFIQPLAEQGLGFLVGFVAGAGFLGTLAG